MAEKKTHAQLKAIIEGGGSVMLDSGQIVSDLSELPSEAQLAKGDARREAAARTALLSQRAALDAQISSLGAGGVSSGSPTPPNTYDELPDNLQGRDALVEDGRFTTKSAVASASDEDLLSVKNVGQKTLDAIREVIPKKE